MYAAFMHWRGSECCLLEIAAGFKVRFVTLTSACGLFAHQSHILQPERLEAVNMPHRCRLYEAKITNQGTEALCSKDATNITA